MARHDRDRRLGGSVLVRPLVALLGLLILIGLPLYQAMTEGNALTLPLIASYIIGIALIVLAIAWPRGDATQRAARGRD